MIYMYQISLLIYINQSISLKFNIFVPTN